MRLRATMRTLAVLALSRCPITEAQNACEAEMEPLSKLELRRMERVASFASSFQEGNDDDDEARRRLSLSIGGDALLESVVPNFFFDVQSEGRNTNRSVARIIPPRPQGHCVGLQAMLALWRGGVTTLRSLQVNYLGPALRAAPVVEACAEEEEGPEQRAPPLLAPPREPQSRSVYVALGEPNTRRELAVAAAGESTDTSRRLPKRGATALLATQGEYLWGIHAEPELLRSRTSVAYFLVMREPISRLVSDYVTYRSSLAAHPLSLAARDGTIVDFGRVSANYALRYLGNDSSCEPRRSRCASLEAFDASMRAGQKRGACHLDYEDEERRLAECTFAKTEDVLRANLDYLKQNMHRLFAGVGLLERLPETLVLWRLASSHHDRHGWPLAACIPPRPPAAAPQASESLRLSQRDIDDLRQMNALDIALYDDVRAAFKMQLVSAQRHGGPDVARLLKGASDGTLPVCAPPPPTPARPTPSSSSSSGQ